MIALDLCQPHYQDLLIIYLKFTAKTVEIKISNTYELCNGDINKFVFLLRKGVYLYKYTNSWRRSDETMLPNKKPFYRELNIEDITDEDYTHAQKVFEKLKFKNPGNYHDLYVQSNTLLLSDVFENFRSALKYMNLTLSTFLSAPGLAWPACFKKTGVELELLTNFDMLLMVEREIRDGICHTINRHAKANNRYMKNYDKNIILFNLMYLDANSLYGWGMSQKLPVNGFKWIKKLSKFDEDFIKKL